MRLSLGSIKPLIDVANRQVEWIAEDALSALITMNGRREREPLLYEYGGRLATLYRAPEGLPTPRAVTVSEMRGWLEFAAVWCHEMMDKNGRVRRKMVAAPAEVANALMTRRPWRYFPPLAGIVTAPVFAADGTLHVAPGYSALTRLYYYEAGGPGDAACLGPEIPDEKPDAEALDAARTLLVEELLADFPFADEASRAHAVALLLLPFVRSMIVGPTPLHMIDAPSPGSGKGELAWACTYIFRGRDLPVTTAPEEGEEWRKKITAALASGPSHIWWDNLPRRLSSADLCAAVTAETWADRLLGASAMTELPVRCVWVATANNVKASDEIARRSVWIRLDPKMDRPWKRSGFKHDPFRAWVREERRALVTAALTLVQAWIAEGMPRRGPRMGSFQSWADIMGGILAVAFVPGFLANQDELLERFDEARGELTEFLEIWHGALGDRPCGVAEVYQLLGTSDLLSERLGDGSDRSRRIRLGRLIAAHEGQVLGSYRIEAAGVTRRAAQYRVLRIDGG
jgi:hypothetical protein